MKKIGLAIVLVLFGLGSANAKTIEANHDLSDLMGMLSSVASGGASLPSLSAGWCVKSSSF